MLKWGLCDHSDAYVLVKGSVTVPNTAATEAAIATNNANEKVIFKNGAPSTDCISEIYNTQIYNSEHLDVVRPKYNLIEYSNNYSKTSEILWEYCRDEPIANDNGVIVNFVANMEEKVMAIMEDLE